MSPTLAMVVNREKEIETFAPETYYTVNLKIGGIIFESRHFENRDEAIEVKQKCCRNIFTELSEEINYMRKTIGYALASKWLVENNMKVRFMYREEPDDASDSGWRFFSGDESDEYVNNPENIGLYSIETISQIDPDITPLLSNDVGTAFERESEKEPFRVSVKIVEVLRLAAARRDLTFRELLSAQSGKIELVVTFLAVLELMKMGVVTLKEAEEEDFLMVPSQELIENTDELAEEIAANIDA